MIDCVGVQQSLQALSEEHRELYGTHMDVLEELPEPLSFYRSYAAQNRPCIVRGAIESWKAKKLWSASYFRDKYADFKDAQQVPVAVTPDGMADAATRMPDTQEEVFALPAEASVSMSALLDHLTASGRRVGNILYMQQQDDCFRKVFNDLLPDIHPMLPWADKAFGAPPQAVNLWIGNSESSTSFHKDPYENMFSVVRGSKTFHLLPPCDHYRLRSRSMPITRYQLVDSDNTAASPLKLVKEEGSQKIRWSAVRPAMKLQDGQAQYAGLYPEEPSPLVVTIHSGETLYLPSLWHHYVEQDVDSDGVCLAVNFWYDMAIDLRVAYYNFTESLGDACQA